jgi:hypothetical protein
MVRKEFDGGEVNQLRFGSSPIFRRYQRKQKFLLLSVEVVGVVDERFEF